MKFLRSSRSEWQNVAFPSTESSEFGAMNLSMLAEHVQSNFLIFILKPTETLVAQISFIVSECSPPTSQLPRPIGQENTLLCSLKGKARYSRLILDTYVYVVNNNVTLIQYIT